MWDPRNQNQVSGQVITSHRICNYLPWHEYLSLMPKDLMFVTVIESSSLDTNFNFFLHLRPRFCRHSLKYVLLVMNIGSPPLTLSPTASRDLIMEPHRAVRHYWRRGQGIQSSSEPTGSLLRYDICCMVSFDIASIYAKIAWSSIKINKLSDDGVVTENHTTTSSRVILLMDGKFNWMVKSWS